MRTTLSSGTPVERAEPSPGVESTGRGLVLLPDIGGLRRLFDDLAQWLADQIGGPVVAVEPWPDHLDHPLDWRLANVGLLTDKRVLADLTEAADLTGGDPVGVVGFCMGGMYTLKAAGTGRFNRAVPFYGMITVPPHWQGEDQGEPLDAVGSAQACPVLAIVGTADPYTPADQVDQLESAGATVQRYEGAEHGFVHDPSRPAHRAADAADAWRRALAFLAE